MGSDLTEVVTIPEAARRAKWKRLRMWRHLKALDRELGGMLLCDVAKPGSKRRRWTVAICALKQLHPQWFHDPEGLEAELESVREEAAVLRRRVAKLEQIQGVHQTVLEHLKPTGTG